MPKHRSTSTEGLPPHGRPVTAEDREQPQQQDQSLLELERKAHRAAPSQLGLFTETPAGALTTFPGGITPLVSESPFDLGRAWYRTHLEQQHRPANTIEAYSYDLVKFEDQIGRKSLNAISRSDIARFLGEANSKSTRKRRLTTLRRFFRYLVDEVRVLSVDPTDGFSSLRHGRIEPAPAGRHPGVRGAIEPCWIAGQLFLNGIVGWDGLTTAN